jgi:vacuolar protein sorting-associated protein 52
MILQEYKRFNIPLVNKRLQLRRSKRVTTRSSVCSYSNPTVRAKPHSVEFVDHGRAREFVELHDQVEVSIQWMLGVFCDLPSTYQSSVNLLDSLETFLSTFQKDLSSVSGQISELQDRSKDIDNRLKSRRVSVLVTLHFFHWFTACQKIEKPLSSLISDITIPPPLASLILDTDVGEPWISAIGDFERRLDTLDTRTRVKAARDLGEVAEGLRIVVFSQL